MVKSLKKAKLSKSHDEAYSQNVQKQDIETKLAKVDDSDLFFEDTVGTSKSRKNKKVYRQVALTDKGEVKEKPFVPKGPTPKPFQTNVKMTQFARRAAKKRRETILREIEAEERAAAEAAMKENDDEDEEAEEDLDMDAMDDEDMDDLLEAFEGDEDMFDDDEDMEMMEYEEDDENADYSGALMPHKLRSTYKATPAAIAKAISSNRHIDYAAAANIKGDYDLWDEELIQASVEKKLNPIRQRELIKHAEWLEDIVKTKLRNRRTKAHDGCSIRRSLKVAPAGLSINPAPEDLAAVVHFAGTRAMKEAIADEKYSARLRGEIEIPDVGPVTDAERRRMEKNMAPVSIVPVAVDIKTRTTRNREHKQKYQNYLVDQQNRALHKDRQIDKVDQYIAEIEAHDDYVTQRQKKRDFIRANTDVSVLQHVGTHRITQAFPEVYTSDKISGNLRTAPQSTQLANDMMEGLYLKNLAVPKSKKSHSHETFISRGRQPLHRLKSSSSARAYKHVNVDEVVAKAQEKARTNPTQFKKDRKRKRNGGNKDVDEEDIWG